MIVFLDFAPIEFMGGAERWMLETAKKINKKEKTHLISVSQEISNIYAKVVLKRKFDSRGKVDHPYSKISLKSLIPFSKEFKKINIKFKKARIIYARYEFAEMIIVLYFAGISGLKKTVAGLHSPFVYKSPQGIMDILHNFLYKSFLSKSILSHTKKIHTLNNRDKEYLINVFSLKNVVFVPNSLKENSVRVEKQVSKYDLRVLFVGELSDRKGVDVLIEIAKCLPNSISLTIVGDGPKQTRVKELEEEFPNIFYKGHLNSEKLHQIYANNDVLLLPSKAESMPLVVLEALSYGLYIVDSKNVSLGFDKDVEHSVSGVNPNRYLRFLIQTSYGDDIKKEKIINFFKENFTDKKIDGSLQSKIFN